MQQKHPIQLGAMWAEDKSKEKGIPIYGVDELTLESRAEWEINNIGIQSPITVIWKGDSIRGYDFSFELVAGVEGSDQFPIDRLALIDYMKMIHSWNAHQYHGSFSEDFGVDSSGTAGGLISNPVAVRLILGDYINQRGVITEVRTIAKPPWGGLIEDPTAARVPGIGGGPSVATKVLNAMAPTTCTFTGKFIFLPGYVQRFGAIDVQVQNRDLGRQHIRTNFFKG